MPPNINPNRNKHYIETCDIYQPSNYPKFLHSIELNPFKQISELKLNFLSPVTVISGTNKIGKTTILMALACSHYNFKKRNATNGHMERHTWSGFMKITQSDTQTVDWSYWIEFREGTKKTKKRGQRKLNTKKWNGIAKKESQIKDRQVVFIDLDRVLPARNVSNSLHRKARNTVGVSITNNLAICLSYIFEDNYANISRLAEHLGRDVFSYSTGASYSGFNSASGEDVITKILFDIMEADNNALILIDELELGLHPKVQRRLLEIINYISQTEKKQFIITTHSPSIFAHIDSKSRIFINRTPTGHLQCIQNASINEALSKMDADLYPAVDIFYEDDIGKKVIQKMYPIIKKETDLDMIDKLTNIIISGSANMTYENFKSHQRTHPYKKIKTGYLCLLDGDMRTKFTPEEGLFYLPGDIAPERHLLSIFLTQNQNSNLNYHVANSNAHILFSKIVEKGFATDEDDAFEKCWAIFEQTAEYYTFAQEFKYFLITNIKNFSA